MKLTLIDFHCHIDLYPDFASLIDECERASVYTLAVTTTPQAWPRNREACAGAKFVRPALGIHPQLIQERFEEIRLWEKYLEQARYVGEVGLDAGPRYFQSLDKQKSVFERVLRACEEQGSKIVSVHSVRAVQQVLDMVETYLPQDRGTIVFHWFTGTIQQAKRAVQLGCYFSLNEQMLSTQSGVKLVRSLPVSRILTETDGPFTFVGSRPATPIDVGRAADVAAKALGISTEVLSAQLRSNLIELLK